MLVPCVSCGKREYTQESPLWFHCDYCLTHSQCRTCGTPKKTSSLLYGVCKPCLNKQEKQLKKEIETIICDGCGLEYRSNYLEYISMWNGYFCERCCETEAG